MKVIPMYLPQFHQIPENDEWWGEGFTEWTNVKKAKPLFEGHYQPRIPLDKNYYDLTDVETLRWQAKIAKEHGIYGFCFYHYWFNSKLLLEKPMELLLKNPDIDINYCVSWANHNWEDSWKASPGREKILIGHDFDDEEDWIKHFNYLLPFFKDPRYMLEDNKPLLIIYIPNIIGKLNKMLALWNKMAVDAGFEGLKYAFQSAMSYHSGGWDRSMFDYGIEFQPGYVNNKKKWFASFNLMKYTHKVKKALGIKRRLQISQKQVSISDYDKTWKKILNNKPSAKNAIPSAFVDWDNTPRKQEAGSVYLGATPTKFKHYFKQLLLKAKHEYKTDKIFVFAWNEWAEGGYLEPDEKFQFGYLNAIKEALIEQNELENS
ncbi:MAG: glycosyl transferase [Helicobacteraceae bacterium]|nr:glycosyl transferase [Helicobacteraceae bacterium]